MPTTDPGSDLLFSTDDEYIDSNGVITCYGPMPPRIRRHLLKSELQRRYIEEIGDGLRNMPPELIITSPSNKNKQKKHSIRILYNSQTAAEDYERNSKTTSLRVPRSMGFKTSSPQYVVLRPYAAGHSQRMCSAVSCPSLQSLQNHYLPVSVS
ncbi:hypothetical protein EVAR_70842_1 [Eumeta japonica]|uniref:Uncharacterized protein n=1 Tax=Eumeta variegata TaxID=151549 RepID=A0A4C1T0U5_EUMVA|nr:hypothetical protein EVAR_70842_1 [Eumeta japonica]